MPSLRAPNPRQTLPQDARDNSIAEPPCSRTFVHRRNRPTARPASRSSRRFRAARQLEYIPHALPSRSSHVEVEGPGHAEQLPAGDALAQACRLLRLEGTDEMQDLIASLVLSECVYKKLELSEQDVAAKVSEFLATFPPGWVQLDSMQITLQEIPQHYIIATSPTTMYVAFMGTKQFQDLLVDANLLHTPVWAESARLAMDRQSIPAAHRGFLERARSIQVEQLYELAVSRGLRLVLCGHSLGGAVAKLCTLRLLRELPDWPRPRVRCISFATPAVGNAALAEMVENAGWAGHFATYYLPEDQLVQLISFAQARNSTNTSTSTSTGRQAGAGGGAGSASAGGAAAGATAAAAVAHGAGAGSRRSRKKKKGASAVDVASDSGRSNGSAATPVDPGSCEPPPHGSSAASATAFRPSPPLLPRVSSSSSVCSSVGFGSMTSSSSVGSSLGRLGTSSSSLSLASADCVPAAAPRDEAVESRHAYGSGIGNVGGSCDAAAAAAAAAVNSGVRSRSASLAGFHPPSQQHVQGFRHPMSAKLSPGSSFRPMALSEAGVAASHGPAAAAAVSCYAGSNGSSSTGSIDMAGSSVFESLDEEQAGLAMEEILAPAPDPMGPATVATCMLGYDSSSGEECSRDRSSGGASSSSSSDAGSSTNGSEGERRSSLAAAARQEALYGKAGGSWGVRLALERKRVLRRMRRMAIRARIPLPRALLPVSRFHTFGAQWFITEEGALSPEELQRRQQQQQHPQQQQQLGQGPRDRENQQQQQQQGAAVAAAAEPPEGARGFFSFHRMLAYRQRHLDIFARLSSGEQQPSESSYHGLGGEITTQHHHHRQQEPAVSGLEARAAPDTNTQGEPSTQPLIKLDIDLMPCISVHHAVLRGTLRSPAQDDISEAEPEAAAPATGAVGGVEPAGLEQPALTPRASTRRWWMVSRAARSGAAAAPVVAAAAAATGTGTAAAAAASGMPVAQLFRWALGGGVGARAGAGGGASGGGGSQEELVRLDLEVEGQNLQYCRRVSVSLRMHTVAAAATSAVDSTAEKKPAHRWGPFPAWSPTPSAAAVAAINVGGVQATAAASASPDGVVVSETDVPCEVVQVLYAQPYSPASNPPPLHPVSLLRNTLHHLAGKWMRRWQRGKAQGAGGSSAGASGSTSWRRFRFRSHLSASAADAGDGSSGGGSSSSSEEEGSDAEVRSTRRGVEVPAAAAMPSRLLLKVKLPRGMARGLLDGTLPAKLTVSARSDFHAVSAVPVVVQRRRVAIIGTSPYAASLVQAALAAPSALAAASLDEHSRAAAVGGGAGGAAAAVWLPPLVAWALSAVRGTAAAPVGWGSTRAATATVAASAATAPVASSSVDDWAAAAASTAQQSQGFAGGASVLAGAFRGRRRRNEVASAPTAQAPAAPEPLAPAAFLAEGNLPLSASVPAGIPLSQPPLHPADSAADAIAAPVLSAASMAASPQLQLPTGQHGAHSSRKQTSAAPPLPQRWVVRLTSGVPRWRIGSGQLQWGLRQSLAAAAVGVAAAAGGVSGAAAALAAAAVIVSALGTAATSGSDGGTAFLGNVAVSVAAAAAAAAAAASAMAGGEAMLAATIAAVAAAAAVTAAAATSGSGTVLASFARVHGSHPNAAAVEKASSLASSSSTATAASAAAGSVTGPLTSLQAPSPGPTPSVVPSTPSNGTTIAPIPFVPIHPHVESTMTATAASSATGSSPAVPHPQPQRPPRPTPHAPRWVLRFGAAPSAVAGTAGTNGAAGGRPLGRGWSLWLRKAGASDTSSTFEAQAPAAPPPPPLLRYGWLPWTRTVRPVASGAAARARPAFSGAAAAAAAAKIADTQTQPCSSSGPSSTSTPSLGVLAGNPVHASTTLPAFQHMQAPPSPPTAAAAAPLQQLARRLFPAPARPADHRKPPPATAPATAAAAATATPTATAKAAAAAPVATPGLRPPKLPLLQLRPQLLGSLRGSSGRAALPLPPAVIAEGVELCNCMVEPSGWARNANPGAAVTATAAAAAAAAGSTATGLQHPEAASAATAVAAVPAALLWPVQPLSSNTPWTAATPTTTSGMHPAATKAAASLPSAAAAAAAAAASHLGSGPGRGKVVGVAPFVAMRRVSEGLRHQALLRPLAVVGLLGRLPLLLGLQVLRRNRHASVANDDSTASTADAASLLRHHMFPGAPPPSAPSLSQLLAATFKTPATPAAVADVSAHQPATPAPATPAFTASPPSTTAAAPSSSSCQPCDWDAVVVTASCRDPLRSLRAKDMEQLRARASDATCPLLPVLLTCPDTPPLRRAAALRALAAACGVEPAAVRTVWLEPELLHRPAADIPHADMSEVWRGTAACDGAAALRGAVLRALETTEQAGKSTQEQQGQQGQGGAAQDEQQQRGSMLSGSGVKGKGI
ncbi:hypothetical protein Agub_g4537 [Astrephomene gubernaculifera]|uniref:Fungal lipase-type domain-containing protein n=1 Tax=Astrephomene gubernaculifera TaxID=47775 RepID=A0AAD3DKB5_9CHLO|nr:hypothetical protein Agub_g4537 [Astrephomene gubernaculifera]